MVHIGSVAKREIDDLLEGRCPIIQEPCPSPKVDGDLSDFFAKELAEIEAELNRWSR